MSNSSVTRSHILYDMGMVRVGFGLIPISWKKPFVTYVGVGVGTISSIKQNVDLEAIDLELKI